MRKLSVLLIIIAAFFAVAALADDPPISTDTGLKVAPAGGFTASAVKQMPATDAPTLVDRVILIKDRLMAKFRGWFNIAETRLPAKMQIANLKGACHAAYARSSGLRS